MTFQISDEWMTCPGLSWSKDDTLRNMSTHNLASTSQPVTLRLSATSWSPNLDHPFCPPHLTWQHFPCDLRRRWVRQGCTSTGSNPIFSQNFNILFIMDFLKLCYGLLFDRCVVWGPSKCHNWSMCLTHLPLAPALLDHHPFLRCPVPRLLPWPVLSLCGRIFPHHPWSGSILFLLSHYPHCLRHCIILPHLPSASQNTQCLQDTTAHLLNEWKNRAFRQLFVHCLHLTPCIIP